MVIFQGKEMVMKTLFEDDELDSLLAEAEMHRKLGGAGGAPLLHALCH